MLALDFKFSKIVVNTYIINRICLNQAFSVFNLLYEIKYIWEWKDDYYYAIYNYNNYNKIIFQ